MQTTGGAKSITREEIRAFKKVWSQYVNPRTGLLERSNLVPFFAVRTSARNLGIWLRQTLQKLTGIFEVTIYPVDYRIPNAMAASTPDDSVESKWQALIVQSEEDPRKPALDVTKLGRVLSTLDQAKIRQRRTLYARLFHESRLISAPVHGVGGIGFTNMLMLLAHYKLINDQDALGYVLSHSSGSVLTRLAESPSRWSGAS